MFRSQEPIVECAGPIRQGKTHSSESLPAPSTSRDEPPGDSGACCVPADESGQPVEPGVELFVEGRYGQQIRMHEIGEEMRAERGQKAPRQGEILDRLRNPVQRAEDLTPRDGVIGLMPLVSY